MAQSRERERESSSVLHGLHQCPSAQDLCWKPNWMDQHPFQETQPDSSALVFWPPWTKINLHLDKEPSFPSLHQYPFPSRIWPLEKPNSIRPEQSFPIWNKMERTKQNLSWNCRSHGRPMGEFKWQMKFARTVFIKRSGAIWFTVKGLKVPSILKQPFPLVPRLANVNMAHEDCINLQYNYIQPNTILWTEGVEKCWTVKE